MDEVEDITFYEFSSDVEEELTEYEDIFPSKSKDDVEGLLYLGQLTETIEVFGHKFTISTLTTGQELSVSLLVKKWEGTIGVSKAFMTATVAASISSVNDRPFYTSLSASDNPSRSTAGLNDRFGKILEWHFPVIKEIFDKYTELVERQILAFKALEGKSLRSQ